MRFIKQTATQIILEGKWFKRWAYSIDPPIIFYYLKRWEWYYGKGDK